MVYMHKMVVIDLLAELQAKAYDRQDFHWP